MVLQRAFAETGRSMYWQINCQRKIIFRSCSTYLLFSGLELPRVGSVLLFVIMQMSSFILPVIKASPPHVIILMLVGTILFYMITLMDLNVGPWNDGHDGVVTVSCFRWSA